MLLKRGFVYATLVVSFIVLCILLLEILLRILIISKWQPLSGAALSFVTALLFIMAHRTFCRWVDRLAYAKWYDYRSLICTMSTGLGQIYDMDALVDHIVTVLRTMHFGSAMLLWPQNGALVVRYSRHAPHFVNMRFPLNGELARELCGLSHYVVQSQLIKRLGTKQLNSAEQTLLEDQQSCYWLPLMSRGQLQGVLIMGKRHAEEQLATEDMDILSTLARQAAVAAENIVLVGQLRTRLEQVEQMRDELVETRNRLAESREAERLHLAQDLHDGPIQDLYGVRFQMSAIEDDLSSEPSRTQLYATLATLQHVIGTLRSTCGDLRPPTLAPFGLEMAVRSHATQLRAMHPELELQLDLMHDGQFIPERERLILFRIYQEALNNIVKHARADWVCIRLELNADLILLEIHDDGCGFQVPERWINLARQGHLGLLGMAERVSLINGTFEVISAEDAGTTIRVTVNRSEDRSPIVAVRN